MRTFLLASLATLFLVSGAQAALIDRGGGFIYDTVQDITWTQNANIRDGQGVYSDGRDTWFAQVAWAASLSLYDSVRDVTYDDWRLPTITQPDTICERSSFFMGFPQQYWGVNCTGSEMSHLFNEDGISASSPSFFTNVQADVYWSGTEFAPNTAQLAWFQDFDSGLQYFNLLKGNIAFAWAVRDGDVVINAAPTAQAGADQSVRAGDTVMLDGSTSFDDNTATVYLLYAWTLMPPQGSSAFLDDSTAATPTFVVDVAGTYSAELVVTDEGGLSSTPDSMMVSSNNMAPTAVAGDDKLVIVGSMAILDGSLSSDPEGDTLAFQWTITSAPAGSTAMLVVDDNIEMPTLTPDLEGLYEVTLDVSDFIGTGTPDTVEIMAASAEGYAETQIVMGNGLVELLGPGYVTTQGNQRALTNFLSQAMYAIQEDEIGEARDKLSKAIARTDGCPLRFSPDEKGSGRDWITDCAAQSEVYIPLNDALDAIAP